ncbi:polysaccharide pyruvyl transferase CsaB [Heyndrickxia sp. FSL K6-6286]|jgi:polysaccharide pyruvyl transferase CsaB|uniref:polysaccharide pyruvyl transferase CsaB n=1 Tax=Heyndrickxia sp. FSL K6-6286 TaxID=2921510 RepID=UPI0003A80EB0|nr:polysaccharide pyruvyl transferase CsaB [Heyndrickxia oleronia]
MQVVISGYYGFNNVGDEAILFSIIQALRLQDPSIKITVLSNNPDSTAKLYDVEAVNRWKLKEIINALKSADGLISGGGSLLQDETGFRSVPYYSGIMKIAQWLHKPVFVYSQGMGPFNKSYSKWIVKSALNKAKQITVRDEESKELLRSIGISKEISIVPDPVMGLSIGQVKNTWLQERSFPESLICVSVRDWPTENHYKEKIALALDRCVENGVGVLFIPMHGKHDDLASQEVAGLMKQESSIYPYDASIEEKIDMIGKSDLLFGMRLHSLIFAAITYTPFIALSYDPKIDAFASRVKQPVLGHVKDTGWDDETVFTEMERMLEQRNNERKKLIEIVEPLKEEAIHVAKSAIDVFHSK